MHPGNSAAFRCKAAISNTSKSRTLLIPKQLIIGIELNLRSCDAPPVHAEHLSKLATSQLESPANLLFVVVAPLTRCRQRVTERISKYLLILDQLSPELTIGQLSGS